MAHIRSQEELLKEEERLRKEIEKKHGKTAEHSDVHRTCMETRQETWLCLDISEDKGEEFIVSIQIAGTLSNTINEQIVKRDSVGSGITILLREIVEYIHEKIFPFEMYALQNMSFFTAKKMRAFYDKDALD